MQPVGGKNCSRLQLTENDPADTLKLLMLGSWCNNLKYNTFVVSQIDWEYFKKLEVSDLKNPTTLVNLTDKN